jgi:hypothetical protein
MGYSRYKPSDWTAHVDTTSTKKREEIFTSRGLDNDLDPKNVIRESRDSDKNPEATAIIVNVDVTGSMGMLAEQLVRKGVGKLFDEILDRKPVSDPHLMITANGDYTCDRVPFQASQFEADIKIADWLTKIYLEGAGGGNNFESYDLPYYFAANQTSIDCFEKRNRKGYLFTMGDEPAPAVLTRSLAEKVLGDTGLETDIPFSQVVDQAMKMYHCFHIIVMEGSYIRHGYCGGIDDVRSTWNEAGMGQRLVELKDINDLSEVIVSLIEVNEGADKEEVASSWDGSTEMTVRSAIKDITSSGDAFNDAMKAVRL